MRKRSPSFRDDLYRYYGRAETIIEKIKRPYELRYIHAFRRFQSTSNPLIKLISMLRIRAISKYSAIQIPYRTQIGKGLYIGHMGTLIINEKAILGDNINLSTGVVIGIENRGKRKGCPTIGNQVWVGTNAVIVGNIVIGNDVLIAPLTFVNFDVPDHSVVVGNPARIIAKDNATDKYIIHCV